jgi:hypothetical protein
MLRSRIALIGLIALSFTLTACSTVSSSVNSTVRSVTSIFHQPAAQAPTRVPVVYSYGPSSRPLQVGYYGYGHYNGYKHCHMVKGKHVHGKYIERHRVCYGNYSRGYVRGYWGCTGYIPAYAAEDRVCSKWEWMPRSYHPYMMYK